MLKVLRDSMKYLAWILWIVIAVFILFVFVDFGGVMPGTQPNQAAATVGDQEITYRELEREHRKKEAEMRAQFGDQYTPELAKQLQIPMQALNTAINRKVLIAEAQRLDLQIGDEELRDYILQFPGFFQDGEFIGQETYKRYLRGQSHTPDSFETEIRNDLLIQRFTSTLQSSFAVSDQAIENRYRRDAERTAIRYVSLPGTQLRTEVKPTPEDIETYFAANREQFTVPEERVAEFLLVNTRTLRETMEIPAEDIATFYSEHEAEYFEQEQVKARHILINNSDRSPEEAAASAESILERIRGGEDFAILARELSDDPGSKTRGGDLGFFTRGRMVKPFEDAAFDAAAGDLVGPVQSPFGSHIIEVQEHKDDRQRPLEEVTDLINNRLASEQAAARAEELVRELHTELSGEAPREFSAIAEAIDAIEIGATRPFRSEGAILPLGNSPALNPQAFGAQVGDLTEPAQAGRGWVILKLTEVIDEHLPELNEVRGLVRRAVVETMSGELALERLIAAQAEAGGAEDILAAVAEALEQTVQQSPSFHAGSNIPILGEAPELVAAAFAAEEGDLGSPVLVDGKAVLYQVTERSRFSSDELETRRPQLRQQMISEQFQATVTALINQRREELGVEYDRGLLESWEILDEPQQG